MFERFTDRARKSMAVANQEAIRLKHGYIGTEHILLGILKENAGIGATVLKNFHVDFEKARIEVEKLMKNGPDPASAGKLPQTPRAKKVIEYAVQEARAVKHNYVGTEHLLLGLIRDPDSLVAQVLTNLGVKSEEIRASTLRVMANGYEDDPRQLHRFTRGNETTPGSPQRFTDRSRKVMALANQEASRFNHEYIAPEHVLLGIVKEGSGVAANLLNNVGVDLPAVRIEIEKLVQSGQATAPLGQLMPTPGAKSVVLFAIEESRKAGNKFIGTEHLLLGLLSDQTGLPVKILTNLGVMPAELRDLVLDYLAHDPRDEKNRQ